MAIANGKLRSILSLEIGGSEWVTDVTSFEITSDDADADAQTFAEYNAGTNREYTLTVTAVWDGGSAGSLHDYLWTNAGSTAEFEIQPVAGTVSAQRPKYVGSVRIPYRPDISIEAGTDSTFEYEFEIVGVPEKVISAS